jgi:hypothetical protein
MLQLIVLLVNSLLANPTVDQNQINAAIQPFNATATYDATAGYATVSNPDGSVIVINPSEND